MTDSCGKRVLRKAQAAQLVPSPRLDVETVLSRAVARVLGTLPSEELHAENVDKPARVRTTPRLSYTSDSSLQMRLLAEQMCKKMELRYEQKMRNIRERERSETERRLSEIRNEYEKERQAMMAAMENDKRCYQDVLLDRERTMRHQIDLRISERENQLDVYRRNLENRLHEFLINKEQFERVKEEYKSKVNLEMERLELERERVARKEASLSHIEERARRITSAFVEAEKNEQNDRIRTLEMRIADLTKQLSIAGSQNYQLRQQLDEKIGIENELQSCKEGCRRLSSEVREGTEKLKKMSNYDDLKEENRHLKRELDDLRSAHESCQVSPGERAKVQREERDRKHAEESAQLKIRELRLALTIVTDRFKKLISERNFLQTELEVFRQDRLKQLLRKHKSHGTHKTQSGAQIFRVQRKKSANSDSSRNISSDLSEGESDFRQIRERIRGIDQMTKELDTCAEQFTVYRSGSADKQIEQKIMTDTYKLDDYYRSLAYHNHQRLHKDVHPELTETSKDRAISPTPSKEYEVSSMISKDYANKVLEIKNFQETIKNKDENNEHERTLTAEDEFAERMRKRNTQRRENGRSLEKKEGANIDKVDHKGSSDLDLIPAPPTPTVKEKEPLFEGVDPVMAQYMALIMKSRQSPQKKTDSPHKQLSRIMSDDYIEVPDLKLDKPGESDDIVW